VHKTGRLGEKRLTEKAIWHLVREYAAKAGIEQVSNLMTYAGRVLGSVTQAGGELEQIPVSARHVSIQTTERYLGCKQRIQGAVNDQIGNRATGLSERSLSALPTTRQKSLHRLCGASMRL